jgi:hypothetical protein
VAGFLVAALVVVGVAVPVWPVLSVTPDGEPARYLRVGEGEPFGLTFVHSLDHLPVEDWYRVADGRIVQDSTRLKQFGAGMGHMPGVGTGRDAGDWWEVVGMDRDIGELLIRVGSPQVDHRLLAGGQVLPLSQCWATQRVTVRPARLSTLQLAASSFLLPRGRASPPTSTTTHLHQHTTAPSTRPTPHPQRRQRPGGKDEHPRIPARTG